MALEVKRKQCDKQVKQRKKEKTRMEEIERELHELKEQLWKEQELQK